MKQTFLTRSDEGVGEGSYDSIAWAFEVHVKQPDNRRYRSAILYGNEDAPVRIEFFVPAAPTVTYAGNPDFIWNAEAR